MQGTTAYGQMQSEREGGYMWLLEKKKCQIGTPPSRIQARIQGGADRHGPPPPFFGQKKKKREKKEEKKKKKKKNKLKEKKNDEKVRKA